MGLKKLIECQVALVFRQQNLARQLASLAEDCHLYVVSRRPRTYIDGRSTRVRRDGSIKGVVVVETGQRQQRHRFTTPFMIQSFARLHWRKDLPRDYYQIVEKGTESLVLHGDTWSFALVATEGLSSLSEHEVLYIGRALGDDARKPALDRILAHEKLQQIYADSMSGYDDIFVSVLRVTGASTAMLFGTLASCEALEDLNPGVLVRNMLRPAEEAIIEQVSLAEAALISYFAPPYNIQYKNRFPREPSSLSRQLKNVGYTNLQVLLDGSSAGVRFWSETRPSNLFHNFECILPSTSDRRGLAKITAAEEMKDHDRSAFDRYALLAETAPIGLGVLPCDVPARILVQGRGGRRRR